MGNPGHPQVRFVVVPFVPANHPALGVSSLASVLQRDGIAADITYLNLAYGDRLGWDFYRYLTGMVPTSFLPGDIIFTRALWGDRARPFEEYEQRVIKWVEFASTGGDAALSRHLAEWRSHAITMRAAIEEAPAVVAAWADEVLAGSPRVVGLTSSFQQNVAALALAREIRRRAPCDEVAIVFGGANCEGDMGRALADNFDFIDCVVSGEAEEVIGDLARDLLAGGDRAASVPRLVNGRMVRDMDGLPVPDFGDYFAAASRSACPEEPWLVAESSRGCWWGAKSHCTFCGLNGGSIAFRSKSASRFASELAALSTRYGITGFALTDNILDMGYLRTFLPDLVARASRYRLFYETKSNLRKDQVELLAAAGIVALQPGIESLSTPVLKLMGKGTTRLQNVQLLKWCSELGVRVNWNVLFGFPGEDPDEYREMAALLPALFHLPAPLGSSNIRIDRFGSYWAEPARYGIRKLPHHWAYDFTFAGISECERERVAYFFERDYADGVDPRVYARPVAELVTEWRQAQADNVKLELRTSPEGPTVVDGRPCRSADVVPVTPAGLAVLRALDAARSRASLTRAVRDAAGLDEVECDRLVAEFLARRFVIEENGSYVSLVVDPAERRRVGERQVALRAHQYGFRWPDDFPDPDKREVVRAAMLALGRPPRPAPADRAAGCA